MKYKMSDFTNSFWPIFITVISVGGVIGCALLLWITSKIKVSSPNNDNTNDEGYSYKEYQL
ncbi:MAG: hypothetical protein VW548_04965, partial [Methylotenera sp.]